VGRRCGLKRWKVKRTIPAAQKLKWAKNIELQRQDIEHVKEDLVGAQDKVSAEIEFVS